ncbi:MAG: hypothetical protein JNK82_09730 [Myxococcaceae bacterium]|nr:hypothetical protein [Myxococcaceae bacterium]
MLALVLSLSLATSVEDYNRVRQDGNNVGLGVLGAWAVASTVTGIVGLAVVKDPRWQGVHIANVAWGVVNIGFAVVGLVLGLQPNATRTDRAGALADGQSTQFTYAWNTALDVGYLAAAALMLMHIENPRARGFAEGSLIQAGWLLFFDGGMALFHQLNNERVVR